MAMSNLFPIISATLPPAMEFVPALFIGLCFGIALEVAGFGNSKILAGQFYFYDMRVFKVMFTAIITAATGVAILTATGMLDMDLVYIPDTFIIPLMVGGFILGMGFMISAYCPGTSLVGAASGKWDGFVTFIGVIIGSVAFGMIQPSVSSFYESTAKGVLTFPKLLGIPFSVLSVILTAAAFFAFLGADKLERIFSRKLNMPEGGKMTAGAKKALIAVFFVGILAVVFQYALPTNRQVQASRQTHITSVDLAQMLIEDPRGLNIVDIREPNVCKGGDIIPQAVCFNDIRDNIEFMYKGKPLVVYSQDGKKELPAEIFKYKGRIAVLDGGYDAWKTTVIGKPEQAYQAILNSSDNEKKEIISAMHFYFTRPKMEVNSEASKTGVIINMPKKRSGGCS
jgi:rhodanese-related sulfurtransferase